MMPHPSSKYLRLFIAVLPRVASCAAIFVGLVVLVGWACNIEPLKRIAPGFVAMNPASAVCFAFAGLSLGLKLPRPLVLGEVSAQRADRLGNTCALLVAGLGLLKLIDHLFGWGLAIDERLFSQKLAHEVGGIPNRMAPNTALNLVFVGTALFFLDRSTAKGRWPSPYFALATALLSLVALMGYAYRVDWLYGIATFIPMALNTAAVFQLLALGILCARPNRSLMAVLLSDSPGGAMARKLVPAVVAVIFVLGWLQIEGARHGFFGAELGITLHTIVTLAIFIALLAWAGHSLHRADALHQETQRALEHERYLLGELMDNATDSIYFKDRESRFIRINRGLASRFGLSSPAVAIGRTDFDFFAEEHARRAYEDEQAVTRSGRVLSREEKETWPNGSVSWVLTTKLPLRDANGQIVGTFGLSRDITKRKTAEAQLLELNVALRARSRELESANQELEAFSYSVSHDLRAPLRHIGGFAVLLGKRLNAAQIDDKSREYLGHIADSVRTMGQLIEDLLMLARCSRSELRRSKVSLDELIAEIRKSVAFEVKDRSIVWDCPSLLVVDGDPVLLRQVFINLIANALKYTRPQSEARIEIGSKTEGDTEVVVFVRDNGVGFDMKTADKLFGAFQRLHSSEEFEGTGIGLAIVRRIVHRHGGRTWAEGAVGAGATFYVSLPIAPSTPASNAPT